MLLNKFILLTVCLIYTVTCLDYTDVGKCKPVVSNPRFVLTQSRKLWKTLYMLDTPKSRTISCSIANITQNEHNGTFYMDSTTVGIEGNREKTITRQFDLRQGRVKEFLIGEDGKQLEFYIYFLKATGCNASVYYRCANNGTLIYDTRYIISTEDNISNECLAKSLAVANAQGFLGKQFIKLPNPPGEC